MSGTIFRAVRALLVAAVILLPAATGWLVLDLLMPRHGAEGSLFFEVERGMGFRTVAKGLQARGILRDSLAPTLAYDVFYSKERLRAGEYEFTFPLSSKDALFKIFRGRIYLHPVTVPEGLTEAEVIELLGSQVPGVTGSFREAFHDTALISDLDPAAKDLEGYLFPETYHFARRVPAGEMAEDMVGQFKKVFEAGWRARASALGMSVRDVVILASLIEKETARPSERPLVSAVFHNRLRLGMKLDCDPTIIYALKLENRYQGRLFTRDLKFPSPYNTYLHAGLPPGPICSPGRGSLEAALFPAAADYLYFVAQSDGSHHFSRSFTEHQEAVKRYLLKKN